MGPSRQPRGPWPRPRKGPFKCRTFTASCSTTQPTGCGRRSNESPVSRCAKPRPRSKRRQARSYRSSRLAPWCRYTCSPVAYPRRPGKGVRSSTSPEQGGSSMLVLSRKRLESVVVGGAVGFERLLKVTVLELRGGSVRLGFEVDSSVPVHRWEVWEKIRSGGQPDSPLEDPTAPVV